MPRLFNQNPSTIYGRPMRHCEKGRRPDSLP